MSRQEVQFDDDQPVIVFTRWLGPIQGLLRTYSDRFITVETPRATWKIASSQITRMEGLS